MFVLFVFNMRLSSVCLFCVFFIECSFLHGEMRNMNIVV